MESDDYPILALDLETTGRDPTRCQVLEIGAILWDAGVTTDFHAIVKHDILIGEWTAFQMNERLLDNPQAITLQELSDAWNSWVERLRIDKITVLGKNFGSFDLQFLKRIYGFNTKIFRSRYIDVGNLMLDPGETVVPDLKECLRRCGVEKEVDHTALGDCRDYLKIWDWWRTYGHV